MWQHRQPAEALGLGAGFRPGFARLAFLRYSLCRRAPLQTMKVMLPPLGRRLHYGAGKELQLNAETATNKTSTATICKHLQLSFQQERRLCRSTAVQNTDVLKMKATSRACAPVRKGSLFGIKVVLGGLRSVVCLGGILILLHVLGRVSLPALVLSEARCCCVKS